MSSSKSVECNAGGHLSCPHTNAECFCECHLELFEEPTVESTEHVDESGQVFVTNYYGEAVPKMLDAPTLVYTNAHWAIDKALERSAGGKYERDLIDDAAEILAFVKTAEAEIEETAEKIKTMNGETVGTTENPQRGSWL